MGVSTQSTWAQLERSTGRISVSNQRDGGEITTHRLGATTASPAEKELQHPTNTQYQFIWMYSKEKLQRKVGVRRWRMADQDNLLTSIQYLLIYTIIYSNH